MIIKYLESSDMSPCPRCNTQNPDGNMFCQNCGQALTGAPGVVAPPPQNTAWVDPNDKGGFGWGCLGFFCGWLIGLIISLVMKGSHPKRSKSIFIGAMINLVTAMVVGAIFGGLFSLGMLAQQDKYDYEEDTSVYRETLGDARMPIDNANLNSTNETIKVAANEQRVGNNTLGYITLPDYFQPFGANTSPTTLQYSDALAQLTIKGGAAEIDPTTGSVNADNIEKTIITLSTNNLSPADNAETARRQMEAAGAVDIGLAEGLMLDKYDSSFIWGVFPDGATYADGFVEPYASYWLFYAFKTDDGLTKTISIEGPLGDEYSGILADETYDFGLAVRDSYASNQ